MLVFDTAGLPATDRRDAVADAITHAASATYMSPEGDPENLHLTMSVWDLGGVELVDAQCSGHTLRRSRKQCGDDGVIVAFTCGLKGQGVHSQYRHALAVGPGHVWATDFAAPYLHQISDTRTVTAKIPLDQLGVPRELVVPALEHIGKSPLANLFVRHLTEVRRVADEVHGAAAQALGTATLALGRAMLASVAGDERLGREALEDALLVRVKAFVRDHLGDPTMNPSRIAAANHVSVRHLYKTCADADLRLEQWIIEQRLVGAHEELARCSSRQVSISEVAARWGFASPSHFARRFRGAYGMSPREWQAVSRERGSFRP